MSLGIYDYFFEEIVVVEISTPDLWEDEVLSGNTILFTYGIWNVDAMEIVQCLEPITKFHWNMTNWKLASIGCSDGDYGEAVFTYGELKEMFVAANMKEISYIDGGIFWIENGKIIRCIPIHELQVSDGKNGFSELRNLKLETMHANRLVK